MLQHFDNGAASKRIDLGLDLIDPRSSFILYFKVIFVRINVFSYIWSTFLLLYE